MGEGFPENSRQNTGGILGYRAKIGHRITAMGQELRDLFHLGSIKGQVLHKSDRTRSCCQDQGLVALEIQIQFCI